jgi:hypothetical protein
MDCDDIQVSTFRSTLALTTAHQSLPQPVRCFTAYHKSLCIFNVQKYCLSVDECTGLNEVSQTEIYTAEALMLDHTSVSWIWLFRG